MTRFSKLICRSRIITAFVAWWQLRRHYRDVAKYRAYRLRSRIYTKPPAQLGALAHYLLTSQPPLLLFRWRPVLHARRSYLYARAIASARRYEYLWEDSEEHFLTLCDSFGPRDAADPAARIDTAHLPEARALRAGINNPSRPRVLRTIRPNLQIPGA